jgi:hypothetical protein
MVRTGRVLVGNTQRSQAFRQFTENQSPFRRKVIFSSQFNTNFSDETKVLTRGRVPDSLDRPGRRVVTML